MLISDLVPYERNAWNNDDGVPAIAESIKRYGFRGQIKVRSREDPVIISGHHRVKALKSLGWTELPDEHIEFCDDMTDDEVKAFRLADNKTGQTGKWNRGLEKAEVRELVARGVDMGKVGFDFKSSARPYGDERLKTDDAYNLRIVNALHCDRNGMPVVEASGARPDALLPFNYAKTAKDADFGKCLHFFVDDYQFERLWNQPERYLPLIKRFAGALSPDFSCYMDMPLPMQRWNEYRRRALANYWQRNGVDVVPTLSWSDPRSYGFMLGGLPKHSAVAVSTVGVKSDDCARSVFMDGMAEAMRRLEPSCVLLYGGNVGFDFGDCDVVEYKANTAFKE